MTNPYTRGTLTTFPTGPAQTPDNVTSLANGAAKGLGSIDVHSSVAADIIVAPMRIKSGASAVGGTVSIYLIVSEDATVWTGGIDPTSASDQATAWNAYLTSISPAPAPLFTITMSANATNYYFPEFSIADIFTNIPSYVSLLIFNGSGAAFDATAGNHYTKYRTDTFA